MGAVATYPPFWESFWLFFQNLEGIPNPNHPDRLMIFLTACALMAVLAVLVDAAFKVVRSESLLGIDHSLRNSSIILVAWVVGATISGFFGYILNILQVSALAALTAGVGWPVIVTKAVEISSREPGETPDAEQEPTEEE